jgi:ABC-type polysaccharide/polyol phosphate transport system ATPase subunit
VPANPSPPIFESPPSPLVELDAVGVRYRLPFNRSRSLREATALWLRRRLIYDEFWALRNVTLRLQAGERLGIVGRNGAGKSTLLAVLARVIPPTCGRLTLRTSVTPLLRLGAGFDFELTGRENVFLNGVLLGLRRADIAQQFDEIVAFAELEAVVDRQLRTYSSGMIARLGFAVAMATRPRLLLLDEVLAVGDESFRSRCTDRLAGLVRAGTSLVVVSHDLGYVRSECTRALWIEAGEVAADADPDQVVQRYLHSLAADAPPATATTNAPTDLLGS